MCVKEKLIIQYLERIVALKLKKKKKKDSGNGVLKSKKEEAAG